MTSSDRIREPEQIQAEAGGNALPFLHLPPNDLFALRARRLERLADGHPLGEYLRLLAGVCRAQQRLIDQPPAHWAPDPQRLSQCIQHGLPPLSAETLAREDAWQVWLDALLFELPDSVSAPVQRAMTRLREADRGQRRAWAVSLLGGQYSGVPAALVPFLGAALQAAWSHGLLTLPSHDFKPGDSLSQCPACGSSAMAGVIRHRGKYNGLRYLVCSLCACEWHVVRVKCVYCEQSAALRYVSLEDDRAAVTKAPVRAEVCPTCNGYLKQVYLECEPDAEALSADLATLMLDMRLDEEGVHRRAPNLLFAPGGD
ncbi:formate dehydrogenase accessory protein FdhE [Pseudomonas sp. GD03842]|uniref:formate dehydrogenase accessory protein FdhE n=1 Tax=Pseudomonas sp. GD03842 TaxID=2975385 RepID=UPI0024492B2D|nr:formate dehydrogenase accessory protein FdhE [Pseudomonas sp. GD03842]MDH0744961.1 formate dehydrogenase accessory protein FdhE [Pseudomonas sp. GD03842]